MSVSGSPAAGPAWRNHSFIPGGGRDPPLSDQGETIIGVYLLLLGGRAHTHTHTLFALWEEQGRFPSRSQSSHRAHT